MRKDILVYLAGPITPKNGYFPEENVIGALKIHLDLLNTGIPSICPQMYGAFPSCWTFVKYETFLEFDLLLMQKCTHVLMLPRWETSSGSIAEHQYAIQHNMPVFYSVDALVDGIL